MNTMSHYYATERSRRRHDRNAKYRALAWVREEREREQRARIRGLVRAIVGHHRGPTSGASGDLMLHLRWRGRFFTLESFQDFFQKALGVFGFWQHHRPFLERKTMRTEFFHYKSHSRQFGQKGPDRLRLGGPQRAALGPLPRHRGTGDAVGGVVQHTRQHAGQHGPLRGRQRGEHLPYDACHPVALLECHREHFQHFDLAGRHRSGL